MTPAATSETIASLSPFPSATILSSPSPSAPAPAPGLAKRLRGAFWKCLIFVWKWVVGAVLCMNPLGALLVVGWTYRLVQRIALKQWWKRRPQRQAGMSFRDFLEADMSTRPHTHWPNWIVQQSVMHELSGRGEQKAARSRAIRLLVAPLHSLWLNAKIGTQGIFNTWVLTLPGCALWLFAWYAGWNNSFHKGYEQWWVGPTTGWLGVLAFMAAMFYLPLAQARQAATGDWRAFYQFRLVRELIRRRWLACLGLAWLYSVFSVPLMVMRAAPAFFPQGMPDLVNASDAQIVKILTVYFFGCCLAVFPAYVLLRLVAARIYASALLASTAAGTVQSAELTAVERSALERLGLACSQARPAKHILVRAVGWTGSRVARTLGTIAALLIWFSFVGQIFILEFFNYHLGLGWLNQPLVQLPWFFDLPTHLDVPWF